MPAKTASMAQGGIHHQVIDSQGFHGYVVACNFSTNQFPAQIFSGHVPHLF
jgi:hypothetical protein